MSVVKKFKCRNTLGFNKITANEKGLAFVGELAFRLPITEA